MMNRRRWLASIASVVVASVGTFVAVVFVNSPTALAEPPSPPFTAFTLDGRAGSGVLIGTRAMDSVSVTVAGETLVFDGQPGSWIANMTPPASAGAWVADTTYPTRRNTPAATDAFLSVSGEGAGCNQQIGTLTVHEVVRVDDVITAFAATFGIGCESTPNVLFGEIRWNSTIDWKAAVTDTGSVNFGTVFVGPPSAAHVVTFTGKGSLPVTFGTPVIEGTDADQFAITGDTCSGQSLEFEETCTVSVSVIATSPGFKSGRLVIPDDTAGAGKHVQLSANALVSNVGTYRPLEPTRILDTRFGTGAPVGKLGADAELGLQVAGLAGMPGFGVSAVVLNVTVTGPTANSFLTVYPEGVPRPTASSLNFVSGFTGANMVTVGLGSAGAVRFYNKNGAVHVIADVVGYYVGDQALAAGAHYNPVVPERLFDSRSDFGFRVPAGFYVRVPFSYGDELDPHIEAVAVNVTAVSPTGNGHFRTWDGATNEIPETSVLNYTTGGVVPNMAVVPVSWCIECDDEGIGFPSLAVYTSTDSHMLVDIMGFFDDAVLGEGLRFTPITPVRIADSRTGLGLPSALGATSTGTVTTPGDIATQGVFGLAMNVTAVTPTVNTFVSVWPGGLEQPVVSNLNPRAGRTVPNSVYTLLGLDDDFHVYNQAGTVHILSDVVGFFYYAPALPPPGVQGAVGGPGTDRGATPTQRQMVDGSYQPVLSSP